MNIKQYEQLRERVERFQRDADRAQGTVDQLYRDLQERFDCKTKKAARRLIADLKVDLEQEDAKFKKALSEFNEEYKDAT